MEAPTLFSLVTMNFSTLCCLMRNILEPLLLSRDSSSSITSLGVLILVPRSSSEASGSDSSSDRTRKKRRVKSSSPQPSTSHCLDLHRYRDYRCKRSIFYSPAIGMFELLFP